jgi:hypothetical protein
MDLRQAVFEIWNFVNWDLFGICILVFGIYSQYSIKIYLSIKSIYPHEMTENHFG